MKTTTTKPSSLGRAIGSTAVLLLSLLKPAFSQAQAGSVVISEVYASGGATGAFKNDFVELYNKSNTPFALTGYSVQYHSANSNNNYTLVPLTGSIPANGYLLVEFGGPASGTPLPAPDETNNTNLATAGGKIALANSTTELPGTTTATDAGIIDFVGYGSAEQFEGTSAAPALTAATSIERKAVASSTSASMAAGGADAQRGNGFDSQNNGQDFVVRSSPEPQNRASAPETAATVFYNTKQPNGPLNALGTYSSTLDGTGPSPTSFSANSQQFIVIGANRTLTGDLTITGTDSRLVLDTNASFTVPEAFDYTGTLELSDNATLTELNADPGVVFNSIAVSSTVEYAQATPYIVPATPSYGNLTLRNATKRLSPGTTVVRGNFLANNVGAANPDVLGGAAGSASTLSLGGNFALTGTVNFSTTADDRITLALTNTTTPQVVNGGDNTIKLLSLTTSTNQAGVSLADGASNLELGNSTDGGYNLGAGSVLAVGGNTLSFVQGGGATIGAGTGQLAVNAGSSLVFSKNSPAELGTLRLTPTSTQLANLTVDAAGGGGLTANANTLTLPRSLTVNGSLTLTAGTLAIGANNVLTLNGPVVAAATGFLRGAATAGLVIGGAGSLADIRFDNGTSANTTLASFTLNRSGATFTLASSLIVENAFALNNGVFAIGSNTLTLNGTVATSATGLLKGGLEPLTFVATSDVYIGGTGPLGTLTFEPSSAVLNILVLNRPGGTLTLEGSAVQITTPTLTSGVLKLSDGVGLNVTGVFDADPAVGRLAVTPTSVLSFTGSGDIGPLAFVAGQDVLQRFTLDRATGTVPTVQLTTTLTVNELSLTRGRVFVQGNNKLIVLPEGSVTGGGNNSYTNTLTQSSVTNQTTKTATLGFPLGVDGQYRPLNFLVEDVNGGTSSYTAHQYEAPSPSRTLPPTLSRVSQIRYYNVVREPGGTSVLNRARITLNYDFASDGVTPATVSFLRVAMADPIDDSKWKDIGGSGLGSSIQSDFFPAGPLGDFTLATDKQTPPNANPLPVELVRFTAERQAAGVRLNWATASEQNSARFEVQRSLDGRTFASVLSVAAQGNSSQLQAYSALDAQAPASRLYYRLRQVDVDGTVAFSEVLTVSGNRASAGELSVYPNPASDRITAVVPAAEGRTYRVLNSLGQVLDRGRAAEANPSVDVRRLPAGTYFLELNSATGRMVRRFVKYD
ncbi:hypothetical protein BEN47_03125 [Hymenobacter lapidarius]|uniref:LTD domain-containing protein n=1 Tax=Hymenobacter lapidarius TaxID=1908237 RepID=A0A1G1T0G2_9BACT|nr:lamin tail domain-containing protein [Hymenobacter lapidarius]OGX84368.1 hypothetical protein BEN47_03125 [Hymenobacter lapidarius]